MTKPFGPFRESEVPMPGGGNTGSGSHAKMPGPAGQAESLKLVARQAVPRFSPLGSYFQTAFIGSKVVTTLLTVIPGTNAGLAASGVGGEMGAMVTAPFGRRPSETSGVCGP